MNCYAPGTRKHTLQTAINNNLERLGELSDFLQGLGIYEEDATTGAILLDNIRTVCPSVANEIHNLESARVLLYRELEDACWGWN